MPLSQVDWMSGKSILVVCTVAALASVDLSRRIKHQTTHLLFATILGTALSVGIIETVQMILSPDVSDNSYAMAFAFLVLILAWKLLFGPWETQTKTTVLGTFLFWVILETLWSEDTLTRSVHVIAASIALVPAAIWCVLFLKYHTERLSAVLLVFFSGMIATVPILFYDALVKRSVEMQFFLFQIKPESFNQISQNFVSDTLSSSLGVHAVLASSFIAFLIVGLIEEISKYWAFSHSAHKLFTSIDDVLQLGVIAAIGFSFAENIVNPVYFGGFVEDYLLHGAAPDFAGFLSNVLGRSVLTGMVHIVSTGVLAYFMGLAIFANSYVREHHSKGLFFLIIHFLHRVFRFPETSIFRTQMMVTGLFLAVLLHGFFNFIVTLPELVSGNPHSLRDILGFASPAFFEHIPFLLLPSLFYVVGGFWLLTHLFLSKDNMVERGHIVTTETLVVEEETE